MEKPISTEASSRDGGDELKHCQVCTEPLVPGKFTPFLAHWMICDDCMVEAALQVLAVFQKRLSSPVGTIVLGSDLNPVMIFDDEEQARYLKGNRASEGRENGSPPVQPIR